MKFSLLSSTLLSALTLFTACGSEVQDLSLDTQPIIGSPDKGTFVNSVEGLEYTRTLTPVAQLTDNASSYSYRPGELINFHIGNLEIGDAIGLSIITPKDIVAYKNLDLNTSIYSSEVNNRVRLLMALDSDNIYSNGIQISQTTRDQAENWSTPNYALSETEFVTELASVSDINLTVTKQEAEVLFAKSLRCVYSGAYSGTWLLPNGEKSGFVGVMIQASNTQDPSSNLGTIITLGDGQDLNGDAIFEEFLFARGTHNMDTGYYDFNETGEFNVSNGGIVPSTQLVKGDGSSLSYNKVVGSFTQTNPDTNVSEVGSYEASRVGQGSNTAYRYTGFGYDNSSDTEDPDNDPILGLFTFDIDVNGTVIGLIHDARNNEEPSITGFVDFNLSNDNANMSLTYPNGGATFKIKGTLAFDGKVNLDWYDENGTIKYGYIDGVGCQLQAHD